jgi:hypothetical protein
LAVRVRVGPERAGHGAPPTTACHHPASVTVGDARGSNGPVVFRFRSMSEADAEAIAAWRYPDEYSFYDWASDPDDLAELLDPHARADEYFAVDSAEGTLIGFFQYKRMHGSGVDIGLRSPLLRAGRVHAVRRQLQSSCDHRLRTRRLRHRSCLQAPDERSRMGVHRDAPTRVRPELEGHSCTLGSPERDVLRRVVA